MQPREFMYGFSDLKQLLVKTYDIQVARDLVKLHFSETDNTLIMHDYNDHKKQVLLSFDLLNMTVAEKLTVKSKRLVREAFTHNDPAAFLNSEFRLYGFFRS